MAWGEWGGEVGRARYCPFQEARRLLCHDPAHLPQMRVGAASKYTNIYTDSCSITKDSDSRPERRVGRRWGVPLHSAPRSASIQLASDFIYYSLLSIHFSHHFYLFNTSAVSGNLKPGNLTPPLCVVTVATTNIPIIASIALLSPSRLGRTACVGGVPQQQQWHLRGRHGWDTMQSAYEWWLMDPQPHHHWREATGGRAFNTSYHNYLPRCQPAPSLSPQTTTHFRASSPACRLIPLMPQLVRSPTHLFNHANNADIPWTRVQLVESQTPAPWGSQGCTLPTTNLRGSDPGLIGAFQGLGITCGIASSTIKYIVYYSNRNLMS
jgi:hypothetical protein